ncbi:MAG: ParA family protein [Deltaproteobacteria bacterium]|nr:ParA family protein [Deltaproteobacteria bacterium]
MKNSAVVVLLGMKGGTGKSTGAIHLAVAAYQAGRRVTLLDTDPQATSMAWSRHREAQEPHVMAARAYEASKRMTANGECDLVVIDTAPRAEGDISKVAALADLIVIPLHCTMPDLLASEVAFRMAKAAERPFVVVFNAVNPRGLEVTEVREALTSQGHTVAPAMLAHHTAFARALSSGLAVTEFEDDGKAAEEIRNLWKWVSKRI